MAANTASKRRISRHLWKFTLARSSASLGSGLLPGLPQNRTISSAFVLANVVCAEVLRSASQWLIFPCGLQSWNVHAGVESTASFWAKTVGSNSLTNGLASSCKKNSSGVLKVIPTLAAKSLDDLSISNCACANSSSRPVNARMVLSITSCNCFATACVANEEGVLKINRICRFEVVIFQ